MKPVATHALCVACDIIAHDVIENQPLRLGSYIALLDADSAEIDRIYCRDVLYNHRLMAFSSEMRTVSMLLARF